MTLDPRAMVAPTLLAISPGATPAVRERLAADITTKPAALRQPSAGDEIIA